MPLYRLHTEYNSHSRRGCAALSLIGGECDTQGLFELQLRLTAVHSESQDDLLLWHRCWICIKGKQEFHLQKSCFKHRKNIYGNWHYYINYSLLTFAIYCWLSALSWHSTFSMNLILWHLACTDDITLTDSAAHAVFSDLITCWTRAVDLITKPFKTTTRLLMGNVWADEDK